MTDLEKPVKLKEKVEVVYERHTKTNYEKISICQDYDCPLKTKDENTLPLNSMKQKKFNSLICQRKIGSYSEFRSSVKSKDTAKV